MNVVLAHSEGYELSPNACERAEENAKASGGSFGHVLTMEEAVRDAEIIYPINWAPYSFLEKRTEFYEAHRAASIELLESELREQNEQYKDWECTEETLEHAAPEAVLMHCLPAQVTDVTCVRGEPRLYLCGGGAAFVLKRPRNRAQIP